MDLGKHLLEKEEEIKQLERVKEGLLLDKDILNQLKVSGMDVSLAKNKIFFRISPPFYQSV